MTQFLAALPKRAFRGDIAVRRHGHSLWLGYVRADHRRVACAGTTVARASGFRSRNTVFPSDGIAIVVLTNGTAGTSDRVTGEIEALLFTPAVDPDAPAALSSVRTLFAQLQAGHPDGSMMTGALNAYFNEQVVCQDFSSSLMPIGTAVTVTQTRTDRRGGLIYRFFKNQGCRKDRGCRDVFHARRKARSVHRLSALIR